MNGEILSAYIMRMAAFTFSPTIPVLYPGIEQTPPTTGAWIEAQSVFPNRNGDEEWDSDSCVVTSGFFSPLVCARKNYGIEPLQEIVDALAAHFPKGLVLGGVRVRERPTPNSLVTEDDGARMFIPLTIRYLGLT